MRSRSKTCKIPIHVPLPITVIILAHPSKFSKFSLLYPEIGFRSIKYDKVCLGTGSPNQVQTSAENYTK